MSTYVCDNDEKHLFDTGQCVTIKFVAPFINFTSIFNGFHLTPPTGGARDR